MNKLMKIVVDFKEVINKNNQFFTPKWGFIPQQNLIKHPFSQYPANVQVNNNNGQMQSSGRFKDGKIVGRWKWFFKTGKPRATGGFDDEEQKHGEWKRYHANGQLWDEGCFEHGKKRGTWKVYDEAGELLKTQTFK